MWNKLFLRISPFVVLLIGCNFFSGPDKDSPQGVLKEYIARTFALKSFSEKSRLLELTTGEVKEALEKLDSESFTKHFLESKKELMSMKLRDERKISDDRYSITYELSYSSKPSDDQVTIKKHALFEKKDGKWFIAEVKNLKTYIEHQNELSF